MISESQIDQVVQAIVENYQPEQIILFGSYANDTAHDNSDLDLAVIKDTAEPWFKRGAEVRMAIRKTGQVHFFAKDIFVFTPEEFVEQKADKYSIAHEISTTGKTLYDSRQPA